jgi:hypothetical protein
MKTLSAFLVLLLLSACAPTTHSTWTPTATINAIGKTPTPDPLEELRQQANIKPEDDGKTFPFPITSRFSVFLDDQNYPVSQLNCSPDGIIGMVSNGSVRGPDLYPIMFEALQAGQCTLTDRDFSVTVIIK